MKKPVSNLLEYRPWFALHMEDLAHRVVEYFKGKGSAVYIEGRIEYSNGKRKVPVACAKPGPGQGNYLGITTWSIT